MSGIASLSILIIVAWLLSARPKQILAKFHAYPLATTLFSATTALLCVLWSIKTNLDEVVQLHFLMLTTLCLLLGYRLTVLSALIALMVTTLFYQHSWEWLAIQGVLSAILPASLSYFVFLAVRSYLPRHLFIYIFLAGFFNGAITLLGYHLGQFAFYHVFSDVNDSILHDHYLLMGSIMMFPEAMLNGMAVTILTVYKPHWLATFRDSEYLR